MYSKVCVWRGALVLEGKFAYLNLNHASMFLAAKQMAISQRSSKRVRVLEGLMQGYIGRCSDL